MTLRNDIFLSIVIPAYNEELNLAPFLDELLKRLSKTSRIEDFEIIVVDDHSSDQTLGVLAKVNSDKVRGLRLSRRSGSHTALRAGIAETKGDRVLCLAADGQDDPAVLESMLMQMDQGCEIVWALRKERRESWGARTGAAFAYFLIKTFITQDRVDVNIANADFFMFSRRFTEAIRQCPERNTSLFGLMLWLGFKQGTVTYERRERMRGKSKWNFRSKARLLADWIIGFSGIPLKIMLVVGFLAALLGLLYALFILIFSLLGYTRPGWAETVILILVMGGVQMLMLGVVGEYLWRNLDETRKRPLYFIEGRVGDPS